MTVLQAIVLGVVQGITEFLPISSSGHLIIFPELLGWQQQGMAFDVIVHVATLLAILWVLWGDIAKILKDVLKDRVKDSALLKIVVATIPVVIFGLAISSELIAGIRTVRVVAINLAVWGVLLWLADWYSTRVKANVKEVKKVGWGSALMIGVVQAFALLPGSSRSGVTITAGLFSGLNRETAAKFSFLLAIPALAGAGLLTVVDVAQHGIDTPIAALIVGFLAAFISGVLSIKFLLKLLVKSHYRWFAVYRIGLALILLVLSI